MGEPVSNLRRIEGHQTQIQGINPTYGGKQGFPLCGTSLENFEGRHGTCFLGQVFHNTVVLDGPCIWIMHRMSMNALRGVKKCVKIWLLNLKRATRIGRRCWFWCSMGGIENVILFGMIMQINCLVAHKMTTFQEYPSW
jgi:hypothetical protein